MGTLGVVVLSLEGMASLDRCLESVLWADAVWVLHFGDDDPCSGPLRVKPAFRKVYSAKVHSVQEVNCFYKEVDTDWVLHLWGEERVEEKLSASLQEVVKNDAAQCPQTYRILIRSHLFHRWLEGSLWGPVPALRLRRRPARFALDWWGLAEKRSGGSEEVLRGWIEDYSACELSQVMNLVRPISRLWMEEASFRGMRVQTFRTAWVALKVFSRLLVQKGNLRKGFAAITFAALGAYVTLLAFAKLWESAQVRKETTPAGWAGMV